MMKNKKYKGFSLIEVMVLFTILSFILLAFIPIFLKRAQKVAESDCVGGLRSVRQEFHVNDNVSAERFNFEIPEEIASELRITLLGAGAGGEDGLIGDEESILVDVSSGLNNTNCFLPRIGIEEDNVTFNNQFYVNTFLDFVENGEAADCDNNRAGNSGAFISNMRILSRKGFETSLNSGRAYQCSFNDGRLNACTQVVSYNNNSYIPWRENRVYAPGFGEIEVNDTDRKSMLLGGTSGANIMIGGQMRGVGGSCVLRGDSYEKEADATGAACQIRYRIGRAGRGGASGAYVKFRTNGVQAGEQYNIHVGRGGNSRNQGVVIAADNTTVSRINSGGEAELIYSAGSATSSDSEAEVSLPQGTPVFEVFNGTSSSARFNASVSGTPGADVSYVKNKTRYTYYQGGSEGCYFPNDSAFLDTVTCIDFQGKPGMFGSGGGGGTCAEEGCGAGGRGGDGMAVVEYLEYCK